jgi:hypothetical protein
MMGYRAAVARSTKRRGHLRRVVGLCVVALLAGTSVAAGATSTVTAAPAKVEALLIGDSVLNGLAQPYSAAGRDALAARHSFILDSAGCRRLITISCRIPPGSAPTNAITVLRARAGQYNRALVVAVGYDDPPSGPFGVGQAVDVMIAEARRQGIHHVIWLTYREAGGAGDVARFKQSNDVLRRRTDPELVIADWATLSASMPASWFSADGIHLGGQASAAMADLIGDTLDDLVPVRCRSGVWSGADPPTAAADPTAPAVGGLNLMPAPIRFVDTRDLPGMLGGLKVLTVPIAGTNGVPADATAALVSVTAVEPCADTFVTVYPCGGSPPTTSMLNAEALSIVANSAIVRLGAGALCVYTLQGTDVIVDVSGWIGATGLKTSPVAPVRLVDTRPGLTQALHVAQTRLGANGLLTVAVGTLPGADPLAVAATVNVTAVDPSADGFLSVLPGPCSTVAVPPTTSNLNVARGRNAAATATVGLGNGELCVYTSTDTDVVVDLQALHGSNGGSTIANAPRRIIDTRETRRIGAGTVLPVDIGATTGAAIVNLTAVAPSGSGFLTLYPCGAAIPTVSNLNVVADSIVANRAVVSTAGSSQFCVYSSVDTDVVIDLEGSITPG